MSKIKWDEEGKKTYETGTKQGVLYPIQNDGTYSLGVPWNGLTAVTESPSGAEASPIYADDVKYLNLFSAEEFGATVEAYTYPKEFEECDGTAEIAAGVTIGQQDRKKFGMSYRTVLGNDVKNDSYGYKLHIIYGAMAQPSEKAYKTKNDSPEAITFSWTLTTTPVNVKDHKPTASLVIDSTKTSAEKMEAIERILYGTDDTDARLPLPDEIVEILGEEVINALEVVTIEPAADAVDVPVNTEIIINFNNPIVQESIKILDTEGSIVSCNHVINDNKVTITPKESLSNSKTYIVMIDHVVDKYSQSLGTVTKKFTTVA